MGRRLERHIDADLVDRILSSGPIKKIENSKKRSRPPRPWWTYRGAWEALLRENLRETRRIEEEREERERQEAA